ncbi:MAG: pyridoxamine 5'-phosphate oxidase family protein [Schwartzia sp.]|nr:pyridoxamine 5'-phosphate oxidase family protein [Schwartzia sp. (in: firmicutes)]
MRRQDRQLSEAAARQLLEEGEYGVLATVGEDDWPYGVPLSYVYDDGKIYFHGATAGQKADNLRHQPRASFTVVGATHVLPAKFSTAYESTIAFGVVRPVPPEQQAAALLLLARKYCYDYMDRAESYARESVGNVGVYCLEIQHLTGKKRPE